MGISQAVKILNKVKHNDYDDWKVEEYEYGHYVKGEYYYDNLTEFEAIAVAEKYEREEQL